MTKPTYVIILVIASISGFVFLFSDDGKSGDTAQSGVTNAPTNGREAADQQQMSGADEAEHSPAGAAQLVQDNATTRRSIFGEPLGDPWQIYSVNIDLAHNGDANAQYEISRVLFECKGVTSQQLIDKHIADGLFTEQAGREAQEQLDWCRELNDNIGSQLLEQSLDWTAAAAEQGHVLANGRQVALAPYNYSIEQAQAIMMNVVQSGAVEMYGMMVSYYANFREEEIIQYEAWSVMMCKQMPGCGSNELRANDGLPPLRQNEQEQVDAAVTQIEAALSTDDWSAIAF